MRGEEGGERSKERSERGGKEERRGKEKRRETHPRTQKRPAATQEYKLHLYLNMYVSKRKHAQACVPQHTGCTHTHTHTTFSSSERSRETST